MSKNYGKYYNPMNNNNALTEKLVEANVVETEEATAIEEPVMEPENTVESVEENTTEVAEVPKVFYSINNCKKLNVRTEPSKEADLVCVLDSTSKFEIEELESEPEWVKVKYDNGTEGFNGFCMKMYVAIR